MVLEEWSSGKGCVLCFALELSAQSFDMPNIVITALGLVIFLLELIHVAGKK